MEEIHRTLLNYQAEGRSCVVATVIDVEGSAYRREGARCLIMEEGEVTGILSGGCIEEDLRGYAGEVMRTGVSRKVYYDFRAGEDDVWGTGIGCNGAITVWLESFDPIRYPDAARDLLEDLQKRAETRLPYEAVTVVTSSDPQLCPPGTRWTRPDGTADNPLGEGRKAGVVPVSLNGVRLELLVEAITPRPELIIVGVGDDARLLCSMAAMLQWRVSILYHLTDKASKERFPEADDIRIIPRLGFEQADIRGKYVVVMSHNLELDREAVRKLLTGDVVYLGLVGSKYRLEHILAHIRAQDRNFDSGLLDKLYSPVGLDIGAETPQEIAMSIMAEVTACRKGRSGGSLRSSKGLGLSAAAHHFPPILPVKESHHV